MKNNKNLYFEIKRKETKHQLVQEQLISYSKCPVRHECSTTLSGKLYTENDNHLSLILYILLIQPHSQCYSPVCHLSQNSLMGNQFSFNFQDEVLFFFLNFITKDAAVVQAFKFYRFVKDAIKCPIPFAKGAIKSPVPFVKGAIKCPVPFVKDAIKCLIPFVKGAVKCPIPFVKGAVKCPVPYVKGAVKCPVPFTKLTFLVASIWLLTSTGSATAVYLALFFSKSLW